MLFNLLQTMDTITHITDDLPRSNTILSAKASERTLSGNLVVRYEDRLLTFDDAEYAGTLRACPHQYPGKTSNRVLFTSSSISIFELLDQEFSFNDSVNLSYGLNGVLYSLEIDASRESDAAQYIVNNAARYSRR
ncbi:hypothetical protein H2248_012355 [Termitomyces sp. 'cryptogamus']|nr:hypothetical protein H2248_012355 [Termitomyces sp. 'cryptogamus']